MTIKLVNIYNASRFILVATFMTFIISCGQESAKNQTGSSEVKSDADELTALNKLIEEDAGNAEALFNRGQYYADKEFYSEAIRDLIKCKELDPKNQACVHALAEAYVNDFRSRLAIETLEEYLREVPDDIPTLLLLAEYQMVIKRWSAAHLNLNKILDKNKVHAPALLMKGLLYRYQEKSLEAVNYLQLAIQSDPDLTDGYILIGQLFEEAGNPMAKKYYENALRIDPTNAEAKMSMANFHWMNNAFEDALNGFDELVQEHPDFYRGYYNRGLLYLELDSIDQARLSFEKAISLQDDFVQGYFYLAEAHILLGQFDEAKDNLTEASKLAPSDESIKNKMIELELLRESK